MYVGLKMLKLNEFVTISPETQVSEAEKLMLANRLWMLLVVEDGRLVGYVSKEDVKESLPSRATSLSKHELNYLLSKLKVSKILTKDVPSIEPQTTIEEAALKMYESNLPGLAVVDSRKRLLGYINRSQMLEVLVEEMGLKQGGSRFAIEVEDRTGVMHEVTGIISGMGINMIATGTFFHNNKRHVVFRVKTDDPSPIIEELVKRGYVMVGPESFEAEWSVA